MLKFHPSKSVNRPLATPATTITQTTGLFITAMTHPPSNPKPLTISPARPLDRTPSQPRATPRPPAAGPACAGSWRGCRPGRGAGAAPRCGGRHTPRSHPVSRLNLLIGLAKWGDGVTKLSTHPENPGSYRMLPILDGETPCFRSRKGPTSRFDGEHQCGTSQDRQPTIRRLNSCASPGIAATLRCEPQMDSAKSETALVGGEGGWGAATRC
jgi:hypothetical protein